MIITVIVPLVLFSTLRYSLIITVATNSVIFCVLRPLIKGTTTFSVFIGFCTCLVSAILLIVYDKALTSNLWSKLKMSLANDELHEVVNASNQGVLIYCRETNRLLLQNATARKMFSNSTQSTSVYFGQSMFFSKADIVNKRSGGGGAGGPSQANIAPVDNESPPSPDRNTEQD